MKKTVRIKDATLLRDTAIELIARKGKVRTMEGASGAVNAYDGSNFRMLYRTPRLQWPARSERVEHLSALATLHGIKVKETLEYGLDIWTSEGKVLNVEWNESGALEIIAFKRGAWEAVLKELKPVDSK